MITSVAYKYDGMRDGREEQLHRKKDWPSGGGKSWRGTHWIQSSLGCSINRAKENVGAVQEKGKTTTGW